MKTNTTTYSLELHYKRPLFSDMVHIKNSDDAYRYIRNSIDTGLINHKEYFWIIPMTRSNRILGLLEVSSGKTDATIVSFKTIAQGCLLANASSCILIHNHPSGNLNPSACDKHITTRAVEMLNLIEVTLLDHFIITQEDYFSFADNNLLDPP